MVYVAFVYSHLGVLKDRIEHWFWREKRIFIINKGIIYLSENINPNPMQENNVMRVLSNF